MKVDKVGIRDVARNAGVSLGTVSNVMNHPDQVSPQNRAKVFQTMKLLNYIPSKAAGQLRGQKSGLVGVMVPDIGNLYWASVIRGVENVCDSAGLGMIVSSSHQDNKRQIEAFDNLMSYGVDGLIVAPINIFADELQTFRSRFGIVSIGKSPVVPYVGNNGEEGMYLATKYLIGLGHRHFGFINGKVGVSWCAARRRGVLKALHEMGLSAKDSLKTATVEDLTVVEGEKGAETILRRCPGVTALICSNDMLALGAILEVKKTGRRIPEDLSIVGYDDVEFAEALNPSLTTVRQPSYELGESAARLLIGDHAEEVRKKEWPVSLIVRNSTGPVSS
ncbi:LacI family DNA-binding transcriptional regulator [Bifidobacterium sp. ESL0732]|uniref:LacI family DNA-binding transcriptional regulator n=1 Tax=Bifidobacterium sp. ESL0732 TaxID=2983222 RepID=UPI0023F7C69F|nr:LacI family DNA-binding transcriptional regulator [Bifidobacterium sp. ESL0732]WEV63816.1 LacI family DNA-binding transcriptional regulator [Bifidobacterium sp. ESL0732]